MNNNIPASSPAAFPKLINWILAIFLLVGFSGLGLYSYHSYQNERDNLLANLSMQAQFTAASSQAVFDNIGNSLDLIGQQVDQRQDINASRPLFDEIAKRHPEVANISVFDASGRVIYVHMNRSAQGLDAFQLQPERRRLLMQEMQLQAPYVVSRTEVGTFLGQWRFSVRHTIRDRQGKPVLMLQAAIPVSRETALWSGLQLLPDTAIALLRDDWFMQARWPVGHPDKTYTTRYDRSPTVAPMRSKPLSGYYHGLVVADQMDRIGAYVRLPRLPLTACVSVPEATILRLWWKHNEAALLTFAAAFIILFGAAFVLLRRERTHRRELLEQSLTDALTGLPSRAAVEQHMQRKIVRLNDARRGFAVLLMDLDRFKAVNDTQGHEAGDQALRAVALRFQAAIGQQDFLARLGGDEFVALIDCDGREKALSMAHRFSSVAQMPVVIQGHAFDLSVSIGISMFPTDGRSAGDLMRQADMAMYSVKNNNRNGIAFYQESMARQAVKRQELQEQLREAIDQEQFVLHYQPKFDQHHQVTSVEALIRWNHPQRGLVMPGEFIPLAEETGMIVEIGQWALATACHQAAAWQEIFHPRLQMAVNISTRRFGQADFIAEVKRVLADSGLPPHLLELEITETMLADDLDLMLRRLKELDQLGVQIALDDFGTGFSSLSYLKQFPIDTIKIDRSFVRDIGGDPDDTEIVKAIISLSHSLQLRVVAEGVETEEQLAFLKRHACHEFQGYLFSKPLPADEVERLFLSAWAKKNSTEPA